MHCNRETSVSHLLDTGILSQHRIPFCSVVPSLLRLRRCCGSVSSRAGGRVSGLRAFPEAPGGEFLQMLPCCLLGCSQV